MDYDIEMEDAAGQYQNEAAQDVPPPEDILAIDADDVQELGDVGEDGEIQDDAATVIRSKVHIRGLDALNPDDIKAYVSEHFSGDGGRKGPFDRIEWIDDTSANLVFASEEAAAAALSALSSVQIDDMNLQQLGQAFPAKTYSAKPDDVSAGLSVRFAVASDKKQAGAAERSRFYLLHPEYDPEERRRNYQNRRRDGYRDGRSNRHRSYRDDRDDRANDIRNNSFDVDLYDDDDVALARRSYSRRSRSRSRARRRSWSRSRSRSRSRERRIHNRDKELFPVGGSARGKELFPEKMGDSSSTPGSSGKDRGRDRGRDTGRLRDRFPSSRNDDDGFYYDDAGDDDYGRLADEQAEAASAAAASNRDKARAIREQLSTAKDGNGSRELFPSDSRSTAQMDLLDSTSAVTSKLSGMSV